MRLYCGVDMGKRKSCFCVMDETGRVLAQITLPNEIPAILAFLKPFGSAIRIVFESCNTWYWFVDGLKAAGYHDLTMAHSLRLAHIVKAKVKTDRNDARRLADLHRINAIPAAYIYPREGRDCRDLARYRQDLVAKRSAELRQVNLFLYRQGVEAQLNRNAVKHVENMDFLYAVGAEHEFLRLVAPDIAERIALLTRQIAAVESALDAAIGTAAGLRLLLEIPGVGRTLAAIIYLECGDIARFRSVKDFCSYCRVTPGIAQSGETTRRGRGSKQGNAYLKSAFSQAAVAATRIYPDIKACYEEHQKRRQGHGGAMVCYNIIAHKLAIAAWQAMHGKVFEMKKLFDVERLRRVV